MITRGDIIETYFKMKQRGIEYLFSKFTFQKNIRIKNTFNQVNIESSNYWIIPEIKEHWNKIISGNPNQEYADYIVKKYYENKTNLKMLSLGCGAGSHEIKFAKHSNFSEITGIDLAPKLIEEANKNAKQNHLSNLHYTVADIDNSHFEDNNFDVILFHSSLHHFKNLDTLLGKTIKKCLKKDGLLIIHEYVGPNRIQWTNEQLNEVNKILTTIPLIYKERYKLNAVKSKAYRSGKLRMIISDPSEAVESSEIIPTIHKYYSTEEEKSLGGNLLMPLFKDIAHHFIDGSDETKRILQLVFDKEETFIKTHTSDFVFGVYRNT
ncbi:MAG: class I SAM-dependent methyltransferase [Bacteroidota bacterium]